MLKHSTIVCSRTATRCERAEPTCCWRPAAKRNSSVSSLGYCGWPFARTGGPVKTEADALDPDPPAEFRRTLQAIQYLERTVAGSSEPEGIVLRYGSFYGPGTGMFAPAMVEQLRHRRVPLIGDGGGWWSFLHVDDAASAALKAIDHGNAGSIYNIVDDDPAEVRQWAPWLSDAIDLPTAGLDRPAAGGRAYRLDDDARPGRIECQGQGRTGLAAGSPLMAPGICGNRRAIP